MVYLTLTVCIVQCRTGKQRPHRQCPRNIFWEFWRSYLPNHSAFRPFSSFLGALKARKARGPAAALAMVRHWHRSHSHIFMQPIHNCYLASYFKQHLGTSILTKKAIELKMRTGLHRYMKCQLQIIKDKTNCWSLVLKPLWHYGKNGKNATDGIVSLPPTTFAKEKLQIMDGNLNLNQCTRML